MPTAARCQLHGSKARKVGCLCSVSGCGPFTRHRPFPICAAFRFSSWLVGFAAVSETSRGWRARSVSHARWMASLSKCVPSIEDASHQASALASHATVLRTRKERRLCRSRSLTRPICLNLSLPTVTLTTSGASAAPLLHESLMLRNQRRWDEVPIHALAREAARKADLP